MKNANQTTTTTTTTATTTPAHGFTCADCALCATNTRDKWPEAGKVYCDKFNQLRPLSQTPPTCFRKS